MKKIFTIHAGQEIKVYLAALAYFSAMTVFAMLYV